MLGRIFLFEKIFSSFIQIQLTHVTICSFKVYNSVYFSILTCMCNQHLNYRIFLSFLRKKCSPIPPCYPPPSTKHWLIYFMTSLTPCIGHFIWPILYNMWTSAASITYHKIFKDHSSCSKYLIPFLSMAAVSLWF